MQEIKMLIVSSSDLEVQLEALPPGIDVKNSQDQFANRSENSGLNSSIEVKTTYELKKRKKSEKYSADSKSESLLVSPSLGANFRESLKKLSKDDKRKLISSLLYTYYPWNPREISLSKHALQNSQIRNASPEDQFYRDILMMRDAILMPGYDMTDSGNYHGSLATSILKKIHFMLRYYEPMYKRDDKWIPFSSAKEIPLASILLHTGRLLIQLPKQSEGEDLSRMIFENFLGVKSECWRFMATHAIEVCPDSSEGFKMGFSPLKKLKELKPRILDTILDMKVGQRLGGHYGLNLALGGYGNQHFLSQNVIDNKGENGHLYLYYLPATQETPGGLLIGIEQSASVGCAEQKVRNYLLGVPDNCGGGHGLGGSNAFSASGGTPWASRNKDENKIKKEGERYKPIPGADELDKHGPGDYYDAMFMSLSESDCRTISDMYKINEFDISWLAEPPLDENNSYKRKCVMPYGFRNDSVETNQNSWWSTVTSFFREPDIMNVSQNRNRRRFGSSREFSHVKPAEINIAQKEH